MKIDEMIGHNHALSEMMCGRGRRSGQYRVFGHPDDCVMVSLVYKGTMGCYDTLQMDWNRKGTSTVTFDIDLTDISLKGNEKAKNPDLNRGGYWWTYSNEWYNWKPDAMLVWGRVLEVLRTCGQD
jgi:hypothetical protein